jgi:competence protein ComEC
MQRFLLGFCCGGLLLALPWPTLVPWPELAGSTLGALAAAAAVALLMPAVRVWRRGLVPAAGAVTGLLWSAAAHDDALRLRFADRPGGDAAALVARVISEPVVIAGTPGQGPSVRFQAVIASPAGAAYPIPEGTVARLSWYGAPTLRRGDEWAFRAVLRGPWSFSNPAGFDYERWLLGAGIHATGYVRSGTLRARPPPLALDRFRAHLGERLAASELPRQGVILALLTGNGGGIPQAQWETFRITGTVHLMVISGLHIGLAAGLGFALGRWACLVCPVLALWMDGRKSGCLCGAALAAGYVALAGAGLPAVRALVMAVCVLALVGWGRNGAVGGTLVLALAAILLLEPLAIHQQGFWLSFGAVGILMLTLGGRYGPAGKIYGLLRAQLALSFGLLPAVAVHTGDIPWVSVPANLLAVPAVSVCVVPAVLAGGALVGPWPAAAAVTWWLADAVLGLVLAWLIALAAAPQFPGAGATGPLLAAQLAAVWCLLRPPWRHLPALALCLALPLAPRLPDLDHGQYRIMALDVGQGAATVIDTRHHRLLFDTGPGYPGGFETGSAVVIPSLLATGPASLDVLVLSHDHLDHTGGAAAVLETLAVDRMFASAASDQFPSCHGRRWRWDGVSFRLLRLPRPENASENDRSCVLLVDDGRHRALLGGDIGARVESVLVRALLADELGGIHLMFAPHHGSATSSSPVLVRSLAPVLVFVNAGRNNRFGHPHTSVIERYERVGARIYQTGRHGALVWTSAKPDEVVRWRVDRSPYWRAQEAVP